MSMRPEFMIVPADCLQALKKMPSNSVHAMVTDPPAGISFMGKEWDGDRGGSKQWIAWFSQVMQECLRVMKPGAHAFVWAIPRTSHWTASALEDAGFEIRDVVTHLFGSGFPKSLDISKAIDKAAGAERKVIGEMRCKIMGGGEYKKAGNPQLQYQITAPSTPEAKQWQGYGTALKPASEHWILVRKPISEKTVAANVLKHGTGGINIDASRIAIDPSDPNSRPNGSIPLDEGGKSSMFKMGGRNYESCDGNTLNLKQGRFPANLVLSHNDDCDIECTPGCAVAMLDEQSGILKSGELKGYKSKESQNNCMSGKNYEREFTKSTASIGGASRFFKTFENDSRFLYCAKASKRERNLGCEGLPEKSWKEQGYRDNESTHLSPRAGAGRTSSNQNHHPTVKPIKLMSYLITMITPPNGVVLDPFMGSGSTGVAAIQSGFSFIGIEREQGYFMIFLARIRNFYEKETHK